MSDAEVLVVGAGAGGAVAAWALVERGIRVTLLETGPRFDPARYGTHGQDFQLLPSPIYDYESEGTQTSYESAPGQPLDPDFAELTSRSLTSLAGHRPTQRGPFQWGRALGVGGSTLHYQGEAHRFPAHAFRMRSERGVAEDWPLSYQELAPYYERIEDLLGVAGDPRNPFKPARGPFPYPAHPLSAASRHVGEAARRLGWSHLPNSLAALPAPRPGRSACHYCNGCVHGCMVGAKGSVDVAVIPAAQRSGRLQLLTGFHVSRLEHGADGRIRGAIGHDAAGSEQRIRARAVVLAAGAIETPRILLNSAGGAHPHGVGNAEDQVGHYLMENLSVSLLGLFDPGLESWVGLPIDSRIWDWNGAAGPAAIPNGFALGQMAGVFEGPQGYAWEGVPGFGIAHREEMARSFGGGLTLFGVAEQLPRQDNRVTLAETTDRFGVPLARVATGLDRADLEALRLMRRRLLELAESCGAAEIVGQISAYDLSNASHACGTCRMGDDPRRSVLAPDGSIHGRPELVIADASVLVTQGAGDSPSLTVQALALRAAERLAERGARGGL